MRRVFSSCTSRNSRLAHCEGIRLAATRYLVALSYPTTQHFPQASCLPTEPGKYASSLLCLCRCQVAPSDKVPLRNTLERRNLASFSRMYQLILSHIKMRFGYGFTRHPDARIIIIRRRIDSKLRLPDARSFTQLHREQIRHSVYRRDSAEDAMKTSRRLETTSR